MGQNQSNSKLIKLIKKRFTDEGYEVPVCGLCDEEKNSYRIVWPKYKLFYILHNDKTLSSDDNTSTPIQHRLSDNFEKRVEQVYTITRDKLSEALRNNLPFSPGGLAH